MPPLPQEILERLDRRSNRHLMELLRAAAERHPEDPDILLPLASLLTSEGHYKEGLEVDRKLAHLCPDDQVVHYNLACSCALTALLDEAFQALDAAFSLGYDDVQHMLADPDLEALRADPRFSSFLQRWTKGR